MRFLKFSWIFLVLSSLLFLTACDQNQQQPAAVSVDSGSTVGLDPGNLAPDFTLVNLQGQKVTLSQLRGKVVIVNFWATWCPPCREEMPSMEKMYRKFKDQGLVLLALNADENGVPAVTMFLKGKDYTFPILLDTASEVQIKYQVFRYPETFIVDRNGRIVEHIIGARDWMSDAMVKRINFLLNG